MTRKPVTPAFPREATRRLEEIKLGIASRPNVVSRVPGLKIGTILERIYKGKTLRVVVVKSGFEFEGEVYGSLSRIARLITSSHWNGLLFFGLVKRQRGPR
jgi:hypothetical protein